MLSVSLMNGVPVVSLNGNGASLSPLPPETLMPTTSAEPLMPARSTRRFEFDPGDDADLRHAMVQWCRDLGYNVEPHPWTDVLEIWGDYLDEAGFDELRYIVTGSRERKAWQAKDAADAACMMA